MSETDSYTDVSQTTTFVRWRLGALNSSVLLLGFSNRGRWVPNSSKLELFDFSRLFTDKLRRLVKFGALKPETLTEGCMSEHSEFVSVMAAVVSVYVVIHCSCMCLGKDNPTHFLSFHLLKHIYIFLILVSLSVNKLSNQETDRFVLMSFL